MFNTLRKYLADNLPELVTPIYITPTGVDALKNPQDARLDALASLFVESDQYLVTGAPAHLALFRRRLTQVS